MKTAEEWLKEKWFDFLDIVEPQEVVVRGDCETEDFIKAVQLDAYLAGLRKAVDLLNDESKIGCILIQQQLYRDRALDIFNSEISRAEKEGV